MIKNVYRSECKVPVIVGRLYWNLNFPEILGKYSDTKFNENASSGSRVVSMLTDARTDGRTDMTKLSVAFGSHASVPEI
jgi:hypothetical protein